MAKTKLTLNRPPEAKPTPASGKMAGRGGTWTLTFGRITVPVLLYTAAREEKVSFNQLHAHGVVDGEATTDYCGGRLKQGKMHCPVCDVDVEKEDIVKGYAIDEKAGNYVVVTPEELEAQKSYASDVMEVLEFVPTSQVDPLYFEASFYLCPDANVNRKTYAVLRAAMVANNTTAVVKITKNQKEQIAFLVPSSDDKGMYCYLSYMVDEIRTVNFPDLPAVQANELALAKKLVDAMTNDFDPQQYEDTYRKNVLALIDAKKAGGPVPVILQKKLPGQVLDLEAAFAASLADVQSKKKAKKAS